MRRSAVKRRSRYRYVRKARRCEQVTDPKRCLEQDICRISRCEAKLFCGVTKRLLSHLGRRQRLEHLERLVDLSSRFLLASAAKERAIAEQIRALSPRQHPKKVTPCAGECNSTCGKEPRGDKEPELPEE